MMLREAPARDACFKVVYSDAEMHEFGDMSEIARRERLHRHAHRTPARHASASDQ